MPRRFVIIGASTGLGRATANVLARQYDVIVAGRDVDRLRAAVPRAREVIRVELGDLADVARFSGELRACGSIDGLICNAGIQNLRTRTTRDGYEDTFAVNHLAHFSIIMRAMPQLTDGARVIVVGSGTLDPDDRGARRFGFRGGRYTSARELATGTGDTTVDEAQRGRDAYATSKQCNLLTMSALARRTTRVSAFAIDPGLMPGTALARDRGWLERFAWNTIMRALPGTSSARRSGRALAWLATDPSLAGTTGRYFDYRRREIAIPEIARRDDWADELYATSLELAGVRDPFGANATRSAG